MNARPALAVVVAAALAALSAAPPLRGEILVVDDARLRADIERVLGDIAENGEPVGADFLKQSAADAPRQIALDLPALAERPADYATLARSVYILGSVYDCGNCDEWHLGGMATAWCLTECGLMVTNHHVFANPRGESWGVTDVDGKVHRVLEVLAADPAADLAIFRVDAEGLRPLPLGPDAPVGSRVSVIGHPDGRFFFHSSGEVSRYWRAPGRRNREATTWMSITADYAIGSSGGPVMNSRGEVVGVVANTQTISARGGEESAENGGRGPVQMVVKNTTPVSLLREMLSAPATAASEP